MSMEMCRFYVLLVILHCLASVAGEELLGVTTTCPESTGDARTCTPNHLQDEPAFYRAEDDVSWAIQNDTLRYGYHQELYDRFLRECRKASPYCKGKEALRLYMNQHQPGSVYNFTLSGYFQQTTPEPLWNLIHDFYQNNRGREVVEYGDTVTPYHNTWDRHTEIVRLDDITLGGGPDLQDRIGRAARPILEAWSGQKLAPVSVYGIRYYKNDSLLTPHVDRMPLVISCIINVDQDVDEDWPLEVYDHQGVAKNITMRPRDMVLYESHSVIHGRPFPLRGRFYANAFLHFEPIGPLDSDALRLNENGAPPYIVPGSIWEKEWKQDHPGGWPLLNDAQKAVRAGDFRTLELISRLRPEGLSEKDENGWAPVFEAVRYGKLDVLRFLFQHGVSPNAKTGLPGGVRALERIPIEVALELLGTDHPVTKYLWTVTVL